MRFGNMSVASIVVAVHLLVPIAAALPIVAADIGRDSTASVTGRVVDVDSHAGVPFVSVIAIGTKRGTMTSDDGSFRITSLPPGRHELRILALGYAKKDTAFSVSAADSADLTIELNPVQFRMSVEAAARESIGADVQIDPHEIECELTPVRSSLKVGRSPQFKVRMRNRSRHTFCLVRSLDGSDDGRYPSVSIAIDGPKNGFTVRSAARCGNTNALEESDIVDLAPGAEFDPFESGWRPYQIQAGKFTRPGRYTATLHYSTASSDVRNWLGWPQPGPLSESLSRHLRRVPLLEVTRSVEFEVRR